MKDFEAIYRSRGAYHHKLSGFPSWWTRDNYSLLARWVDPGDRVLDLACGDGGLWPHLQSLAVVGADLSLAGLKLARQTANHPVVQAGMRALPFKPGSFDAVVCSLSLQYVPLHELEMCLAEIARVLRPRGVFLFSYPNIRPDAGADDSHAGIPYEFLAVFLKKAGFRLLSVRSISPRLPRFLFSWSFRTGWKILASVYYRAGRRLSRDPLHSHHFAVACEFAGPGFEGDAP
jgi:ubiquinone/menaquinone biosynthesis C-methylase UbiE